MSVSKCLCLVYVSGACVCAMSSLWSCVVLSRVCVCVLFLRHVRALFLCGKFLCHVLWSCSYLVLLS